MSGAYDVLGDAEKRKEYDEVRQMVAAGYAPGGAGGPFGWPGAGGIQFDFDTDGGLGDILGGLFGRGRRPWAIASAPGPRRGQDLETELHLGFEDAVRGVTSTRAFHRRSHLLHVSRLGRRARNRTRDLPAVRRLRCRSPSTRARSRCRRCAPTAAGAGR